MKSKHPFLNVSAVKQLAASQGKRASSNFLTLLNSWVRRKIRLACKKNETTTLYQIDVQNAVPYLGGDIVCPSQAVIGEKAWYLTGSEVKAEVHLNSKRFSDAFLEAMEAAVYNRVLAACAVHNGGGKTLNAIIAGYVGLTQ